MSFAGSGQRAPIKREQLGPGALCSGGVISLTALDGPAVVRASKDLDLSSQIGGLQGVRQGGLGGWIALVVVVRNQDQVFRLGGGDQTCLLYTSPSPRD